MGKKQAPKRNALSHGQKKNRKELAAKQSAVAESEMTRLNKRKKGEKYRLKRYLFYPRCKYKCPSYHTHTSTRLLPLYSLRILTTTTRFHSTKQQQQQRQNQHYIYIPNGNTKAESTRNSFLCEATLRPIERPTDQHM